MHMRRQGFGMISLIMYTQLKFLFMQEEIGNLSLCKSLPSLVFLAFVSVFLHGASPCNVSDLMITIFDFWHYAPYSLSIDGV